MQMNGMLRRRKKWPDSSRACPLWSDLFARSLAATRPGSVHASTDTQHETLEAHRTGAEKTGGHHAIGHHNAPLSVPMLHAGAVERSSQKDHWT